ncbi:MAG: transposase [Vulcanimicrobiota bacterium]
MNTQEIAAPLSRAERRRELRAIRQRAQCLDLESILRKEGLSALAHQAGMAALMKLMEDEIDRHCGVRGKWEQNSGARRGYRNGWEIGTVWVGGRPVSIERPRAIRTKEAGGGEIALESYLAAQDPDFASDAVLTSLVLGVSQRTFSTVVNAVNPVGNVPVKGLSKSAVGRLFIAAASQYLKVFLSRRLDQRYLVVWIDAVSAGDYSALAAIGLLESGEKQVLGLRQCSSEGTAECSEFLEELSERGLSAKDGLLFVVDGGKGIGAALREVFGNQVLVQRCQVHKKRNVLDKLPESERDSLSKQLEELWSCTDPRLAQVKMKLLAGSLHSQGFSSAARSLREGGQELLTACILGIPPNLLATVTNTNVIESAFSLHESTSHRVKRWRNGKQFLRWVAAGLYRAERAFGRITDQQALAKLGAALKSYVEKRKRRTAEPVRPVILLAS